MAATKWTYETLKASALKFTTIKEWRVSEPSAYSTASQRKLLPELTKHMASARRYGYWTEERIVESARKFKTRSEWARQESSAYHKSIKLGIHDKVTAHMDVVGSKYLRCLYVITVTGTDLVYVGLTYTFKRRMRNHAESKRFKQLAAIYGDEAIIQTQLTDYIDAELAQQKEADLINKYANQGFKLLNKAKAGSLGGNTVKWTEEAILEDSGNYTSVMEWVKAPKSGYASAASLGILDKATAHMERIIKAPGSWNKEEVIAHSTQYQTISEWVHNHQKSYAAAQRLNLLNDPDVVGHFSKGKVVNCKWTVSAVIENSKKYSSKSEWKKSDPSAYRAAQRHGIFEDVTQHMAASPRVQQWTKEAVLSESNKYTSKSEWKRESAGSYGAARKNGWIEEASTHMEILNPIGKWSSKEAVIESAKASSTRNDWYRRCAGAYEAAIRNGWFEEAVAHIKGGRKLRGFWTKERVIESAKPYKKPSHWKNAKPTAYKKARDNGWFEEATEHMRKT